MTELLPRVISLLIGYFSGCFLTAEVVTRKITGKPCRELGTTGNPGMANVMAHLGFVPGILVLAGDLLKTVLAVLISWLLFRSSCQDAGRLAVCYAALGTTLGHNYPFWQRFHGGKGVATSCAGYFLMDPVFGLLSMILGMLVVFATQYLGLGAVVIAAVYIVFAFLLHGIEEGWIAVALFLLMVIKHGPAVREIFRGDAERVDVLGAIKKKFGKRRDKTGSDV